MKSGLVVDNLNYGILNDVSFSIETGTFNALIGKSGSGKSTLLKSMAGLYNYTGCVSFNGNVITKSSSIIESIGIFTNLFTSILVQGTVFENLMEPLLNLEIKESTAKKKIYGISRELDIESLLYKDVEFLSYSEKKFIGIVRSIIHHPSIILLDNPLDSLDSNYRNKLILYLKSLKKSIIIFTTNNSEDLMLADNIMILKDGKLIANDRRNSIFENEFIFTKNGLKLPFIIELSHKLKSYELTDKLVYSCEEAVNELWK